MTPLWLTREGLMPATPSPGRCRTCGAGRTCCRWPRAARNWCRSAAVGNAARSASATPGCPATRTPRRRCGPRSSTWPPARTPRSTGTASRRSGSCWKARGCGRWWTVTRSRCAAGDLLLTPGWAFHGHQNVSDTPMAWLDGLDIPLVAQTDQGFFEFGPDQVRTRATPERSNSERLWGRPGLTPVGLAGPRPGLAADGLPLGAHRRGAHRPAGIGRRRRRGGAGAGPRRGPVHQPHQRRGRADHDAHRVPPAAGRRGHPPVPHLRVFRLAGFRRQRRGPLKTQQRNLQRGDVIAVPAWTEFALQAASQLDVFTFSDAPVFEKLNLLRSEVS